MARESTKPMDGFSIEKLQPFLQLYEGCGNMLGVVPLTIAGYPKEADWLKDKQLRKFLRSWGQQIRSDSVMVLTGNPYDHKQEYDFFMDVFEPSGTDNTGKGLAGGVSTMCGNGIRAVAAYTRTFKPNINVARIMSRSGLRTVEIDKLKDLYAVDMGEFVYGKEDLSQYVCPDLVAPDGNGIYIDSFIPQEICRVLGQHVPVTTWCIGLTGDRNSNGRIDGEPHLVINVPHNGVKDIRELRRLAVAVGPVITKASSHFPLEINANFIVIDGKDDGVLSVLNVTHERNLGDDADHSVTAACGTGSTVVGAIMFEKNLVQTDQIVRVYNTGGIVEISRNPRTNRMILTGPAKPVSIK